MENIDFDLVNKEFRINGFPDARKIINLEQTKLHHRARQLAHLVLHRNDLTFAKNSLSQIPLVHDENRFLAEALWRAAIVHFVKCFTSAKSRSKLSEDKLFKSEPPEVMASYNYLKDLRDKHFVHDENAWAQCKTAALVNDGSKSFKIEKIVCQSVHIQTLEPNNFTNLTLLVDKALSWVIGEFDKKCVELTEELEKLSYAELIAFPSPEIKIPDAAGVSQVR